VHGEQENEKEMNHYKLLVSNVERQFYAMGLKVKSDYMTRDIIRLTLPYADTTMTLHVLYQSDDYAQGHEISLVSLGLCSRETCIQIMQTVMHDITKASLFDGVFALYNAAKEEQMLQAERVTNTIAGGSAFQSRLPGIEYLNAGDQSWVHCKVPLSQVSLDNGPPSISSGSRLSLSFRCKFDNGVASNNPRIFLSGSSYSNSQLKIQLPKWDSSKTTVNQYVEHVTNLVRNQWKRRYSFYNCLDEYFHYPINWSTIHQDFRSFLVEHEFSGTASSSNKKKIKTRLCLVCIRMVKPFPENAPKVTLHQIWPDIGHSADYEIVLPHSPRWTPEEMGSRLHNEVVEAMHQGW
jgi:hypothetical protein